MASGITIWVYLATRRQPVPVQNVTAIDFLAAQDCNNGQVYRNTFAGPVYEPGGTPGSNSYVRTFVDKDHPLPDNWDVDTDHNLSSISDEYAGKEPYALVSKRDKIVFTTDPAVADDKLWAWADEVLMVSNADPNTAPGTEGYGWVTLQRRRSPVPVRGLSGTSKDTLDVYFGDTIRNTFPEGVKLLYAASTGNKRTFITPSNPLPATFDASSTPSALVVVADPVAGIPPRPVKSTRDVLSLAVSTLTVGGDMGLFAWADEVLITSNSAA
jgi:hypothetical protein